MSIHDDMPSAGVASLFVLVQRVLVCLFLPAHGSINPGAIDRSSPSREASTECRRYRRIDGADEIHTLSSWVVFRSGVAGKQDPQYLRSKSVSGFMFSVSLSCVVCHSSQVRNAYVTG